MRPNPYAPWKQMLSAQSAITSSDTIIPNGMSRLMFSRIYLMGLIKAVSPNIKNTLKIFDPTTLPIAISGCPSMPEITLTTNSGMLVPMPTIVAPMMYSEMR